MKGFVMPLFFALAVLLVGCASQPSSPTVVPTVAPTIVPTAEVETPTPEPTEVATPEPTVTPEQQLAALRASIASVLSGVFSQDVTFTEDNDPTSGVTTYYAVATSNSFDLQASVAKAISKQWPPTKTLIEMQGESGGKKTIAYTQSSLQNPKVETVAEMECNGFSQFVTLTVTESNTGSLEFKNLGGTAVKKLIDACP
ncbi:MAG: hypothetical protein V1717_03620 [Candidatus Micrarchaeota archaeon]